MPESSIDWRNPAISQSEMNPQSSILNHQWGGGIPG
jgi:hypothetical protein